MVAFRAHEGQMDRAGLPYILHPIHVAEQMTNEDSCVVALLHDVIEDTDLTEQDLRKEGFTDPQIEAVLLMTRSKDEDYFEYVRRLKKNEIAREVKRADLAHNMDRTRLKELRPKDEERFLKYQKAWQILADEEGPAGE